MAIHLVTGGSGYVESFIIKKLIEIGETVYSLDVIDPLERNKKLITLKDQYLIKT